MGFPSTLETGRNPRVVEHGIHQLVDRRSGHQMFRRSCLNLGRIERLLFEIGNVDRGEDRRLAGFDVIVPHVVVRMVREEQVRGRLKEQGQSRKNNSNRLLLMINIQHSENWTILKSTSPCN